MSLFTSGRLEKFCHIAEIFSFLCSLEATYDSQFHMFSDTNVRLVTSVWCAVLITVVSFSDYLNGKIHG